MFIVQSDNTWPERAVILAAGITAGIAAYTATGIWWAMVIAQIVAIEAAHILIGLRNARR